MVIQWITSRGRGRVGITHHQDVALSPAAADAGVRGSIRSNQIIEAKDPPLHHATPLTISSRAGRIGGGIVGDAAVRKPTGIIFNNSLHFGETPIARALNVSCYRFYCLPSNILQARL